MKITCTDSSLYKAFTQKPPFKKPKSLNESTFNKILDSHDHRKSMKPKSKKLISLNYMPPKSRRASKQKVGNKKDIPLVAEISLTDIDNKKSITRNNSSKQMDIIKVNDEILELELKNSRLQNELMILNEKNSTLNNLISIKDTEIEVMKNKYTNIINDMTQENKTLREKNDQNMTKFKETNDKQIDALRSFLSLVIDLIDIMILPRVGPTNNNIISNNNGVECSLDVYDSFNCDEDRKTSLIDQIQSILMAKISKITKMFKITLDQKYFDKINNWNNTPYTKRSSTLQINTNEELSKIYINSNDTSNDLDLSVSGNFYRFSSVSGNNTINNTMTANKNVSSSPKFKEGKEDETSTSNKKSNNILDYSLGNINFSEKKPEEQTENLQKIHSIADISPSNENVNNFTLEYVDSEVQKN